MLQKEIILFSENLDALRDFVVSANPILSGESLELTSEDIYHLVPIVFGLSDLFPKMFPEIGDKKDAVLGKMGGDISISSEIVEDSSGDYVQIEVHGDLDRELDLDRGWDTFWQFKRLSGKERLLYHSSLVSLISFVELFISEIFHEYYKRFPANIPGRDENVFSLDKLETLGSIDDAKSIILDTKIEGILRRGFEHWMSTLKKTLSLSMGYVEEHKAVLSEVYQRRNLLVHNGGKVNAQYIAKVPTENRGSVAIGEKMEISDEYLGKSISTFEKCLILIAAEYWKKQGTRPKARGILLNQFSRDHICAGRYDIAEGFSYFVKNDKKIPEKERLEGTINYWQSMKWSGRFDEVITEVSEADFSAADDKFLLAKYALLNQEKEFFALLPSILEAEKLSLKDLANEPLYKEMRESEEYIEKYYTE